MVHTDITLSDAFIGQYLICMSILWEFSPWSMFICLVVGKYHVKLPIKKAQEEAVTSTA